MADLPELPMSQSRRLLVASAAGVVAAALAKARETSAASAGTAQFEPTPPPQGKPLVLETENTARLTTTLKYVESPRDAASSQPGLRLETAEGMAGMQIIGREWADALGVTMTASDPQSPAPTPGLLVVGRPGVVVTDTNVDDRQRPVEVANSVAIAASGRSSAVALNIGEEGVGVTGIQVPVGNPAYVSEAFGVTATAVVDFTTGVLGVAATGAGLRGRALLSGGIGAILEAPRGPGEIAAKVKGDLVVEDGNVRAESGRFAGDIDIDGELRVKGFPILPPPPPPIHGTGVFLAGTSSADIKHARIMPGCFVQVVFTAEPRPKGLAVSHIDMFQGGCSVQLTGRARVDIPFSWIVFC